MKIQDISILESIIDPKFIKHNCPEFYIPPILTIFDAYKIIESLTISGLNPHPLFDESYMRDSFGPNWLFGYLNQTDSYILPNRIIDLQFFYSQVYTSKSIIVELFNQKDISFNSDVDLRNYASSVSHLPAYEHLFGDYCFRNHYSL